MKLSNYQLIYNFCSALIILCFYTQCVHNKNTIAYNNNVDSSKIIHYSEEYHFRNVRQLTFGGDNAEAYWSYDGKSLVFQKTKPEEGIACDQIYKAKIPRNKNTLWQPVRVSNGEGRTTCSYFMPDDKAIIYASTHAYSKECPPVADRKKIGKYVWNIYPEFELYVKDLNTNVTKRLTENTYYDAEATVSPDGKKIVFTSTRNGDLDLYVMDIDGSNIKQVSSGLGYDGGAFFSPDSKSLVFRASRPKTEEEITTYRALLKQDMVTPSDMEIYTVNIDGSNLQQITYLGNANWAPYFHPSGKKIIFASNHTSKRGFPFNLYMINTDGTGLTRITHSSSFDAFPMFSPNSKQIVFCSNRNNGNTRDTNIFIADWVE